MSSGPLKTSLDKRWASARDRARAALRESQAWKQRLPEAKALMARIDLLSEEDQKKEKARVTLAEFIDDDESDQVDAARFSLVRSLLEDGQYERAAGLAAELESAPVLFLRALSELGQAGQRAQVIKIIDGANTEKLPLLPLFRARVLLAGNQEERERGIAELEKIALAPESDWPLVRDCYMRIKAAGEPQRALALLEKASAGDDPDAQFTAHLERTVAAVQDSGASDAQLAKLAVAAEDEKLVIAYHVLSQVGDAGALAARQVLDRAVDAAFGSSERRLVRATLLSGQKGAAVADLVAISEDAGASRETLVNAAAVAAASEEPKLLGRLMARALVSDEGEGNPIAVLQRASAANDAGRAQIAEGVRVTAAAVAPYGDWLRALADAFSAGDLVALRRPAGEWAPTEQAPQPLEPILQAVLASVARDWGEAEAYARKIMDTWPDRVAGAARLGIVLLRQKRFDEVLALHAGDELTPIERAQRVDALRGLDRQDDAVAEARTLLSETDGSDAALLVLGELLRDTNPDAALAALTPVQGISGAELLKGELLEVRGDVSSASQIYEELLRVSGNRDLEAWGRLARVLGLQDRPFEFVARVNSVIDEPPPGMPSNHVAHLVLLRAQAREQMKDYERALEDYQLVVRIVPDSVVALNNAAWIMTHHIPYRAAERAARTREALEYADRAASAAPDIPAIVHTRAKILLGMEQFDRAVADFDRAIELMQRRIDGVPTSKRGSDTYRSTQLQHARYRLDKADALLLMDEPTRARDIFTQVRDAHPKTPEGRRAKVALEKLGV